MICFCSVTMKMTMTPVSVGWTRRFDIREVFHLAVDSLVVADDGGGIEFVPFARADQLQNDGGADLRVPDDANRFDGAPGKLPRGRDVAARLFIIVGRCLPRTWAFRPIGLPLAASAMEGPTQTATNTATINKPGQSQPAGCFTNWTNRTRRPFAISLAAAKPPPPTVCRSVLVRLPMSKDLEYFGGGPVRIII